MSVHQYIGARYVPKFYTNSVDQTTNWEDNVTYEPLTWVTLENDHMYLSRKTVPAEIGTPAENEEYWLEVGSFNGYISDLQSQIDTANTNIASNTTAINTANTNIANNAAAIEELKIKPLSRIVFLGDSYGVQPSTVDNFVVNFKNYYNYSDDDCINASVSATGFTLDSPYTFLEALTSKASLITSPETISDIIVVGGYNDMERGTLSLTTERAVAFKEYCNETYPNAKVSFVYAGVYRSDASSVARMNIIDNCETYLQYIAKAGINVTERVDKVLYPFSCVQSDHLHPSTTGAQNLAIAIYQAMTGCNVSVPHYVGTITFAGTVADISHLVVVNKDSTLFNINCSWAPGVTLANSDTATLTLGTYTSDILSQYATSYYVNIPVTITLYTSTEWIEGTANLVLSGGNVTLQNISLTSSTGWYNGFIGTIVVRGMGYIPTEFI